MLTILIDGKRAAVKDNLSFEFVTSNSSFDKTDSYTLEISFPLKDCPQNIDIFGMLFRKDAYPEKYVFKCDIIDRSFQKTGSIIITEFTESEVKCQFLEGKSGVNLTSPLAEIYINEISIAKPDTSKNNISPEDAWKADRDFVALPWVNNDTGLMQNKLSFDNSAENPSWHSETKKLSWMPYLTTVIKGVCRAIGFSCDISDIENDESTKYLLICNALPAAWDNPEIAHALPHWTVSEFFEKLEDFLNGEFNIDHYEKSVKFISAKSLFDATQLVKIDSDVKEFTADVFIDDSECKAKDCAKICYKKSEHSMQNWYDCPWVIERFRNYDEVVEYESLEALAKAYNNGFKFTDDGHRTSNIGKLYYITNLNQYYAFQEYTFEESKTRLANLHSVNEFGPINEDDSEEGRTIELEFVPACIDMTDNVYYFTLFLSPGNVYAYTITSDSQQAWWEDLTADAPQEGSDGNHRGHSSYSAGVVQMIISNGEQEKENKEVYDRIYIGWWDGNRLSSGNPYPNVSYMACNVGYERTKRMNFNLSLTDKDSVFSKYARRIDNSVRYNINFISDSMPNPKSLFLIKGKMYVCEKLSTNITAKGMSSLIKGVFWRIKD